MLLIQLDFKESKSYIQKQNMFKELYKVEVCVNLKKKCFSSVMVKTVDF